MPRDASCHARGAPHTTHSVTAWRHTRSPSRSRACSHSHAHKHATVGGAGPLPLCRTHTHSHHFPPPVAHTHTFARMHLQTERAIRRGVVGPSTCGPASWVIHWYGPHSIPRHCLCVRVHAGADARESRVAQKRQASGGAQIAPMARCVSSVSVSSPLDCFPCAVGSMCVRARTYTYARLPLSCTCSGACPRHHRSQCRIWHVCTYCVRVCRRVCARVNIYSSHSVGRR